MRKERIEVAERVAQRLKRSECLVDELLRETCALVAETSAGVEHVGLSAHMNQEALKRTLMVTSGIGQIREQLLSAHDAFAELKENAGLRTVSVGDWGPKPPHLQDTSGLRAVA